MGVRALSGGKTRAGRPTKRRIKDLAAPIVQQTYRALLFGFLLCRFRLLLDLDVQDVRRFAEIWVVPANRLVEILGFVDHPIGEDRPQLPPGIQA